MHPLAGDAAAPRGLEELLARADALERRVRAEARRASRPRRLLAETRGGVRLLPLEERLVVGRGAGCGLTLSSARVSRAHAALTVREGELVVEDLGSTNGTWAAGDAVEIRPLAPGEEVWFGDEPVRFWVAEVRGEG